MFQPYGATTGVGGFASLVDITALAGFNNKLFNTEHTNKASQAGAEHMYSRRTLGWCFLGSGKGRGLTTGDGPPKAYDRYVDRTQR